MFNKDQLLVVCNIIAAVESEGQVYHTRETAAGYGDFAEAYTNSTAEHSITLGRYQHYGVEALQLLKLIYSKDPSLFTDELVYDMDNRDWNNYAITKTSNKAKTIIKIISSPIGKQCQDELIGEQMQQYVAYAESLGVTDVQAQAMCANFQHQGGKGAVTRILAKTPHPYTLDNLYNASKSDTGNQVGAYRTRQTAVRSMIKQYLPVLAPAEYIDDGLAPAEYIENEPTLAPPEYVIDPGTRAEDILNIMRGWIGLNQYDGSHMQIVNLYNNYLPRARGYALTPYDSWCDCTVSAAFIKANAVDLIGGTECGVQEHIKLFTKKGIWIEDGTITPLPGDIICFNWDESRQPNDGFADHIGIVEYVEGGVIHTIEGNASGRVQRRTYPVGHGNIRGFARPKYGADSSTTLVSGGTTAVPKSGAASSATTTTGLRKGSSGEAVAAMQSMLITCGYDCGSYGADGDFGNDTYKALVKFQQDHGLAANGVYDDATKAALKKASADAATPTDWFIEETFPKTMYTVKDPYSYLREGPSKSQPIIGKFGVGMKVKATKSHVNKAGNLWYKVNVSGVKGWIVGTSLSENKP